MKTLQKIVSALLCIALSMPAFAKSDKTAYRDALNLYRHGMYERAMSLFNQSDDPLCHDYAVLCAIRLDLPTCPELVNEVDFFRPRTILHSSIHHLYGLNLFDASDYERAFEEFSKVDRSRIRSRERIELSFKMGYCKYACGDDEACIPYFQEVCEAPYSRYTGPARFVLGSISYAASDFEQAEKWFSLTVKDERFENLSSFYLVDCRFMKKDYPYVIENGERIFRSQGTERQQYLSRILSEAYLVEGNSAKAREFLELEDTTENRTYEDIFHKASVLYAVGDYNGAIENFNRMENPFDSLGQIAMYQLGNSYLQTKNKVNALDAFKEAMTINFNPAITEDAFFNYAKLSFEINNDIEPLKNYSDTYSVSKKGEELYRYLALCALRSRNYSEAVEYYDEIDEISETDQLNYTKASFLRSHQLLSAGSYKEAIKYLRCVPHFLPKNDPVARLSRYWLADTYYRVESWNESLKVYKDLYNTSSAVKDATSVLLPYNIAFCHFRLKEFRDAAKWFDIYLASSDSLVREDALIRRADCDFERGMYNECAISYKRVLNEYPEHLYAYYFQSVAYELLRNNEGCISALEPVLSMQPGVPYYTECMNSLGLAYIRSGKYAEAEKAFTILGENSVDNASKVLSHMGLGVVMRNTGKSDLAIEEYKSVVALMPGSTYCDDALQALKSIYGQNGHPETFLAYLDSVGMGDTQSAEDRDELYFNTAQQVFLSGDYAKAVTLLNMYFDNCPSGNNAASVHFYLGESYKNLGRKEACIREYRASLEIDANGPFSELSMLGIATVCYGLERYKEAFDAYAMLCDSARLPANSETAQLGAMRSAFRCKYYNQAIEYASAVSGGEFPEDVRLEAKYVQARSFLNTSRRTEAFEIFTDLSASASTSYGAEACFMILQSRFDLGQFDSVESGVYDFASRCGDQTYWLARAYILLGDTFVARENIPQARVTFNSIKSEYVPSSQDDDILDIVNQKLSELE